MNRHIVFGRLGPSWCVWIERGQFFATLCDFTSCAKRIIAVVKVANLTFHNLPNRFGSGNASLD